jgi:hypothetical protein
MWCETAISYWKKWKFPNSIGRLDGKHIDIKCPGSRGSQYYSYKQYFWIFLQALVDVDFKLIAVDIRAVGHRSDGRNFRSTSLFRLLERGKLNVPSDTELF